MALQCFVIQPFDNGPYDKLYKAHIAPAILAAGMSPYRVDRDPAAQVIYEQVEAEIRASHICVADVTENNPNVWYEVGFAVASEKPLVLLYGAMRQGLPFDVRHRASISYQPHTADDFVELQNKLTTTLIALLESDTVVHRPRAGRRTATSLQANEHTVLRIVAESPDGLDGGATINAIARHLPSEMPATMLVGVLKSLEAYGFVSCHLKAMDGENPIVGYVTTRAGLEWLEARRGDGPRTAGNVAQGR